jgi:hypothetical protein
MAVTERNRIVSMVGDKSVLGRKGSVETITAGVSGQIRTGSTVATVALAAHAVED